MSNIILREYQNKLIDDLRNSFKSGKKRPLVVAPCGAGKTVMFSYMADSAVKKGLSVLILAHREELLFQISETLDLFGCAHGFIMPGVNLDPKKPVQVGSVFSVNKRSSQFKNPDLIIIDECHHFSKGNTWSKVVDKYPLARIVGVTATPCRLDGKALGDLFDDMIMGPTTRELILSGDLSDYTAFAPALVSLDGLKSKMGDYLKDEISELMDKPSITGSAVAEWIKYARNKKTIVFCVSVQHAENVAAEYMRNGISARSIDGKMDKRIRRQILSEFKSGKIQVLVNVSIATEGFDVKTIDCVQLLRPTASLSLYIQIVGRGLRTYDGKEKALFLDHVKAIETHGLPDEEREWSLSERIKKRSSKDGKNEVPVKVCLSCFAANNSFNHFCVHCGAPFEVKKRDGPEELEGELLEIDKKNFKKQMRKDQGQAESFDDLVAIGIKRKYKNPHAWAKFVLKGRSKK